MRLPLLLLLSLLCVAPAVADPTEIVCTSLLVHEKVTGGSNRDPLHTDPIEAAIVDGTWAPPRSFDAGWRAIAPGEDGWFEAEELTGGYAYWGVESTEERVMILEAAGHQMVYANGEPRGGDIYSYGYVRLPVLLKRGTNTFLFAMGRGRLSAKLTEPRADVWINADDLTLPDALRGVTLEATMGVSLVNATRDWIRDAAIEAGAAVMRYHLPPLSCTKVVVPIVAMPASEGVEIPLTIRVGHGTRRDLGGGMEVTAIDHVSDEVEVTLRVREPGEPYKRTFISEIDGSCQYYAVNPQTIDADSPDKPALVLSLHGASVEAIGQAQAYGPRNWADIICPTNRRPYGFDWEEWGDADAMEVLNDALSRGDYDRTRIYLTGHSMGGHGVWHVAAMHPELFAAIGPSAGWESFYTYGGKSRSTSESPLMRSLELAAGAVDTGLYIDRYKDMGVYILHGDADDNVPVGEARGMRQHLIDAGHTNFEYHEEPGKSHWWDLDQERPGADCVDWQPMWEFFRQHALDAPMTEPVPIDGGLHGFSRAFNNRFMLVYGTHGTEEENAWSYAKARFDAEQWWYRGNGYAELVPDTAIAAGDLEDRNLILYGNADTIAGWPDLVDKGALTPILGSASFVEKTFEGGDLGVVMLCGRRGRPQLVVGVVGGTGLPGMRLTDRLRYLSPGTGYPDGLLVSGAVLREVESGVLSIGTFRRTAQSMYTDWQYMP